MGSAPDHYAAFIPCQEQEGSQLPPAALPGIQLFPPPGECTGARRSRCEACTGRAGQLPGPQTLRPATPSPRNQEGRPDVLPLAGFFVSCCPGSFRACSLGATVSLLLPSDPGGFPAKFWGEQDSRMSRSGGAPLPNHRPNQAQAEPYPASSPQTVPRSQAGRRLSPGAVCPPSRS